MGKWEEEIELISNPVKKQKIFRKKLSHDSECCGRDPKNTSNAYMYKLNFKIAIWAKTSYEYYITMTRMSWHTGCNSTVCSISCQWPTKKKKKKAPHLWTFVREIHRWPVDSSLKGSVMWKALLYHDVIMDVMANNWKKTVTNKPSV